MKNTQLFGLRKFSFLILCFIAVLCGCGGGSGNALQSVMELNKSNIQKLTTCYTMFYGFKSSKGPESEDALKSFINDNSNLDVQLERIGLAREDFDSCFQGDDGEPLKVFYGVSAPSGAGQEKPIVFGASGGIYRVGFSDGSTKEVDEDEYNRLLDEASKKKR